MSLSPIRILCLGEALVDLIGERRGARLTEVDCFAPHFGGVAARAEAHLPLRRLRLVGGVLEGRATFLGLQLRIEVDAGELRDQREWDDLADLGQPGCLHLMHIV